MWAVLLGVLLVLAAATSSHAAVRAPRRATLHSLTTAANAPALHSATLPRARS
jgi:hypothetical protein